MRSVLEDPRIGGFAVTLCQDAPSHVWRTLIVEFFTSNDPDELLLLYISGHAVKDKAGKLYFAATDTRTDRLLATAIPASFIYDALSGAPRRRVLLILDTCFSGAFATGIKAAQAVNFADYFDEGAGVAVLAASGAIQHALGDRNDAHIRPSLFSRHIIEGLRSGKADLDGDGEVSVEDLFGYVSHKVRGETGHQQPEKWHFGVGADLALASNPFPRPGRLPQDIVELLEDSRADVRALAVGKLARLLTAKPLSLSLAARHALKQLRSDDSRKVSDAAAAVLRKAHAQPAAATVAPVPSSTQPRARLRQEPASGGRSPALAAAPSTLEALVSRARAAVSRRRRSHGARLLVQAFNNAGKPPSPEAHAWLIEAGEAWVVAARSSRALRAFTLAHSVAFTRAAAGPTSDPWQGALAASLTKMGEALTVQGNLRGALERFKAALDIRGKLAVAAPADSERLHELAVSQVKAGEAMTAQGDPAGGLDAFRAAQAIGEKLALVDQTNASWQRDLAITYHRIGETLRAQGDFAGALQSSQAALGLMEQLAADSTSMAWQRDLASVHRGMAETLRLQGELNAALRTYQAALDISKRLVVCDPTHTQWRRDVAVASRGKGETLTAQGDLIGGLRSYRAALGISEQLAAADPSNTLWQRDVARSKTLVRQISLKRKIGTLAARAEQEPQQGAQGAAAAALAAGRPPEPVRTPSAVQASARVTASPSPRAVDSSPVPRRAQVSPAGPAPPFSATPARTGPSATLSPQQQEIRPAVSLKGALVLAMACYYAGVPWVASFFAASGPAMVAEEAVRALVGGSVGIFLHRLLVYCKDEDWREPARFWRSFMVIPLPVVAALGLGIAVQFPTPLSTLNACLAMAGALCALGLLLRSLKQP
jgi:tetratricopeptide (TPR) repeat protein